MRKLLTLLLLSGLFLILAGCGGTGHEQEASHVQPTVTVPVEKAGTGLEGSITELGGTVRSVVTTTVSSQTFGRVLSTRYDEGDRVKAKAEMLTIDPEQAKAGAAQAEAALREAELALREVERGSGAAVAGLNMAKANAAVAESTFNRFKALLEKEAVSRQEYEQVEAGHLAAQAAVEQAQQSVLAMEEKQSQVKAKIEQAEAGVTQAKLNLGYASVTAPFNGVITRKMVQPGQLASPGVPLYEIEKSAYELHVPVDVARSRRLESGQEIPVSFDHMEGILNGKIREVVPVADPVSRTVLVKITLPETPGVYSGLFGRAIFRDEESVSLSVPIAALVRRGQLTGVYVVESDSSARYRLVKTGRKSDSRIEILSGLNEGEAVVVEPGKVSEGVLVEAR